VARSGEQAAVAAAEIGEGHLGFACDVSRGEEVEAAILRTLKHFGRIDAIHNNAGVAHPAKPLHETSESEWDTLMDTNLKSVFHTTRHGFAALKESKGCILNTSSLVGVIGQEDHAAYTASKGGMNTLTKSMALDYAPYGIRVNAVCPAGTWTPMLHQWADSQPDTAGIERYLDNIHALGYCPDGDVIADTSVFLLSDDARFVTGHIMHVSGGAELGYRVSKRPNPTE
jgi:meso-butanediol dehydrogenase/(S,S)-butanediol dehydrogenase/diacetyl reductase